MVLDGLPSSSKAKITKHLNAVPKTMLDPEQFRKVVLNLVLNAQDAVGDRGEIRVETDQHNGWASLKITDNGCGMSPEFLSRSLFRPFQTTKKKGLGIGMFHTKMIVEAHRGKIEVESKLGQGTTFCILLPLEKKI